ncbi:hypothetical protein F3Y22_tig00110013pilonHSYRG00471 [Hibiscus syriacus]|uniref:Uncharacterized protein n=1 Tax=Hibiscus syriacus TaxID=106335 RepID=A0A6A3BR77_HIBSY|nr:hypothetical protein F3Y22_tig00110013pilonHSYRG00471 [Hibiscus syriacus]
MQKLSTSILQKDKRTADEVRSAVAELENVVRMFSQLFAASNLLLHGFDEKKINIHVEYCKHLLEAAKVYQVRRKAEEQRKCLLERRKQEDEQKRFQQAEEHFKRVNDKCKSSSNPSRRRDMPAIDDEEVGHSEKRRRKCGKGRRNDKNKSRYERDDDMMDEDANRNYRESTTQINYQDDDDGENPLDLLTAAGLEDSDLKDNEVVAPSLAAGKRRQALS